MSSVGDRAAALMSPQQLWLLTRDQGSQHFSMESEGVQKPPDLSEVLRIVDVPPPLLKSRQSKTETEAHRKEHGVCLYWPATPGHGACLLLGIGPVCSWADCDWHTQ